MVSLTALWLLILLSAIIVFVASSIMHMLLPYHRSDYQQLPGEDKLLASLRTNPLVLRRPPFARVVVSTVRPKSLTPSGFLATTTRKIRDPHLTRIPRPNHEEFETFLLAFFSV